MVRVNAREGRQDIEHTVNILDAECRIVEVARLAARGSLERSIGRDRDVAGFREFLCVKTCYLLLDAAVWMGHDDGLVFFAVFCVIAGRRVDVCGNLIAVEVVRYRMNVDFARLILRDSIAVNKTIRILVRTLDFARSEFTQVLSTIVLNFMIRLRYRKRCGGRLYGISGKAADTHQADGQSRCEHFP